jgi:hypothetical protein
LIKLFGEYLPELSLKEEELVPLLHRLSELMPEDVKQAMFETCLPIKIFHKEKVGSKRSRDPTDLDSYEARCSKCVCYFPLEELGMDGHGRVICRMCSQANGTLILTTFEFLSFKKVRESPCESP